ncbi:MAG: SDR family oxidoreductase [Desulforegulaceae bacterium]|nr:SDR family oxidoreductase [Desulforegulaceae bacterium]
MKIKGKVVLITGANGGIGTALVNELLTRGAEKIYAAVRSNPSDCKFEKDVDGKVVPIKLDITNAEDVKSAADQCKDVDILINNAGINRLMWLTGPSGMEAARNEMEVNFFGTLAVSQAFAPILASRGGGAMVIVSSIIGIISMPANSTYCCSKAAAHSMTQGLRGELSAQGTLVAGVYPGPVETPMTDGQEMPKAKPEQVADAILTGLENGQEDIFPDPMSQDVYAQFTKDPKQAEKELGAIVPPQEV